MSAKCNLSIRLVYTGNFSNDQNALSKIKISAWRRTSELTERSSSTESITDGLVSTLQIVNQPMCFPRITDEGKGLSKRNRNKRKNTGRLQEDEV
jgi:hypothetical protein